MIKRTFNIEVVVAAMLYYLGNDLPAAEARMFLLRIMELIEFLTHGVVAREHINTGVRALVEAYHFDICEQQPELCRAVKALPFGLRPTDQALENLRRQFGDKVELRIPGKSE